jgi:hypothetical protein
MSTPGQPPILVEGLVQGPLEHGRGSEENSDVR